MGGVSRLFGQVSFDAAGKTIAKQSRSVDAFPSHRTGEAGLETLAELLWFPMHLPCRPSRELPLTVCE